METRKQNYNNLKKIINRIIKITSWLFLAIFIIVVLFLSYSFVVSKVYEKKGEIYKPNISLYTIVSPSMEPKLKVYDVIINKKVKKPEDIKVGDIITFISTSNASKGLTVTHRVVAIVETENGIEYQTQGDNNMTLDATNVLFQNVLGKVIFTIPKLGRVQQFFSTSFGWLFIVVIPAFIIILNDIIKILKLARAKKKFATMQQIENRKDENK